MDFHHRTLSCFCFLSWHYIFLSMTCIHQCTLMTPSYSGTPPLNRPFIDSGLLWYTFALVHYFQPCASGLCTKTIIPFGHSRTESTLPFYSIDSLSQLFLPVPLFLRYYSISLYIENLVIVRTYVKERAYSVSFGFVVVENHVTSLYYSYLYTLRSIL